MIKLRIFSELCELRMFYFYSVLFDFKKKFLGRGDLYIKTALYLPFYNQNFFLSCVFLYFFYVFVCLFVHAYTIQINICWILLTLRPFIFASLSFQWKFSSLFCCCLIFSKFSSFTLCLYSFFLSLFLFFFHFFNNLLCCRFAFAKNYFSFDISHYWIELKNFHSENVHRCSIYREFRKSQTTERIVWKTVFIWFALSARFKEIKSAVFFFLPLSCCWLFACIKWNLWCMHTSTLHLQKKKQIWLTYNFTSTFIWNI